MKMTTPTEQTTRTFNTHETDALLEEATVLLIKYKELDLEIVQPALPSIDVLHQEFKEAKQEHSKMVSAIKRQSKGAQRKSKKMVIKPRATKAKHAPYWNKEEAIQRAQYTEALGKKLQILEKYKNINLNAVTYPKCEQDIIGNDIDFIDICKYFLLRSSTIALSTARTESNIIGSVKINHSRFSPINYDDAFLAHMSEMSMRDDSETANVQCFSCPKFRGSLKNDITALYFWYSHYVIREGNYLLAAQSFAKDLIQGERYSRQRTLFGWNCFDNDVCPIAMFSFVNLFFNRGISDITIPSFISLFKRVSIRHDKVTIIRFFDEKNKYMLSPRLRRVAGLKNVNDQLFNPLISHDFYRNMCVFDSIAVNIQNYFMSCLRFPKFKPRYMARDIVLRAINLGGYKVPLLENTAKFGDSDYMPEEDGAEPNADRINESVEVGLAKSVEIASAIVGKLVEKVGQDLKTTIKEGIANTKYKFLSMVNPLIETIMEYIEPLVNIVTTIYSKIKSMLKTLLSKIGVYEKNIPNIGLSDVLYFFVCMVAFYTTDNSIIKGLLFILIAQRFHVLDTLKDSFTKLSESWRLEGEIDDLPLLRDTSDDDLSSTWTWTSFVRLFNFENDAMIGKLVACVLLAITGFAATVSHRKVISEIVVDMFKNFHFTAAGVFGIIRLFELIPGLVTKLMSFIRSTYFADLSKEEQEAKEKETSSKEEFYRQAVTFISFVTALSSDEGVATLRCTPELQKKIVDMRATSILLRVNLLSSSADTLNITLKVELRNALTTYQKLHNVVYRTCNFEGFRATPYHVQFYGEPGVGKSTLLNAITQNVRDRYYEGKQLSSLVWARGTSEHFDGYHQQPIMLHDDMFKVNDAKDTVECLTLISNVPLPVPMAHLEDKGMFFTSKFIFSTVNVPYPNVKDVLCIEAVYRRRHLLVEVICDSKVKNPATSKFDIGMFKTAYPSYVVKRKRKNDKGEEIEVEALDEVRFKNTLPHLSFNFVKPIPNFMDPYESEMVAADNYFTEECELPAGLELPLTGLSYADLLQKIFTRYDVIREEEEIVRDNTGVIESQSVKHDMALVEHYVSNFGTKGFKLLYDNIDIGDFVEEDGVATKVHPKLAESIKAELDTIEKVTTKIIDASTTSVSVPDVDTIAMVSDVAEVLTDTMFNPNHCNPLRMFGPEFSGVSNKKVNKACAVKVETDPILVAEAKRRKRILAARGKADPGKDVAIALAEPFGTKRGISGPILDHTPNYTSGKLLNGDQLPIWPEAGPYFKPWVAFVDKDGEQFFSEIQKKEVEHLKIDFLKRITFDEEKDQYSFADADYRDRLLKNSRSCRLLNWHLSTVENISSILPEFRYQCDLFFSFNAEQRMYLLELSNLHYPLLSGLITIRSEVARYFKNTGLFMLDALFGTIRVFVNSLVYLIPLVIAAATFGHVYMLYKSVSELFKPKVDTSRVLFKREAPPILRNTSASPHVVEQTTSTLSHNVVHCCIEGTSFNGIGLDGHLLLVNLHSILRNYEKGEEFQMEIRPTSNTDTMWPVLIRPQDIHIVPNADAAIIYCRYIPSFRRIKHLFVTNSDLTAHEIPGSIYHMYMPGRGGFNVHNYNVTDFKNNFDYASCILGKRQFRSVLMFAASPTPGSSGGPIYAPSNYFTRCVYGIQASKDSRTAYCSIVTQEDIEIAIKKFPQNIIQEGPAFLDSTCLPATAELINSHVRPIGSIKAARVLGICNKSQLQPSIISSAFESERIPAILDAFDDRVPPNTHPLQYSINKTGRDVMRPLPTDALDWAEKTLCTYLASKFGTFTPRILTYREAIEGLHRDGFNSMNLKTSPGIPYVYEKQQPGKKTWLTFDIEGNLDYVDPQLMIKLIEMDTCLQDGVVPASSMYEFPKDELRPISKVLGPPIKTRSVSVLNMCYAIIYRRYSLDFNAKLHSLSDGTFMFGVGINPSSLAWTNMYQSATAVGEHGFDFDVGNWDGHWTMQIHERVENVKTFFYRQNPTYSIAREKVMNAIIDMCIYGFFQFLDLVCQKLRGMCSGYPGTAEDNTLGHILLILAFFYCIMKRRNRMDLLSLAFFLYYVFLVVYGDDVIATLRPESGLTPSDFVELYEYYGWPITSATKEHDPRELKHVSKLQFLKRSFVPDEVMGYALVHGAIEKSVITDLLYWARNSVDQVQQLYVNINEAFEFAVPYGSVFYDTIYNQVNTTLYHLGYKGYPIDYLAMRDRILTRILF
nr:MAG: non-structural polyprotein [Beetle polycipi-like virus 2]